MDTFTPIPNYQPLPLPLPVWLMQTLLVLGFFLHALPMNVILGGGFICAVLFAISKGKQSYQYRAAKALAISLPVFISFAVTQGIVPLLFLQLLYGPAFYTSSIVMAVPWISLLLVVMTSYYLSYITIYKVLRKEDDASATRAAMVLLVMAIGFAIVGYVFSNNMTLMLSPQKWLPMYQASPKGLNLNSSEPTLIPRYLHMLVSSFAVAGMTMGLFGLFVKNDEKYSQWLIKTGSRIFVAWTLIQIPVGLWFLKTLPPQFAAKFMGGDNVASLVFAGSMALMVVALCATCISAQNANRIAFLGGLIANALLILAMIVNRHQLRLFHLQDYVKPDSVPVSTQWDLLAIFLVSTVALIFYLVWLSKLVFRALSPKKEETAATSLLGTTP
ncbi:MAG TPA: hypothetical protein V6C89_03985 [Drouetiella sp.]